MKANGSFKSNYDFSPIRFYGTVDELYGNDGKGEHE
jgi:hypothetical protein